MKDPRAVPLEAPASYPFPKGTEGLLPWFFAESRLGPARNYWIVTVRPDGRPHVTPVWGVWLDGALYLDGSPSTRWARNAAANPEMSVHLESAEEVVIVEGRVEDLPAIEGYLAERIVEAWDAKYGRLHPDPAGSGMFRLQPRRARGWSASSLQDGTRWLFDSRQG